MEGIVPHDIFATKGVEYLLLISFLVLLVLLIRYLGRTRSPRSG